MLLITHLPRGFFLSRIMNEFDMGCLSDMPIVSFDMNACLLDKYKSIHCLSDEEMSYCNTVKELIDCVQNNSVCGLHYDECKQLIQYLATI